MRLLRIIGIAIACLIVLIIAALIALRLAINPNDYKGRIEAAVKSSTGRELSLSGNIRLSVFPRIAVELGPASLGNPPGFPSNQPFASVQRASLRVALLPLLSKQLQVGHIDIDGLDLHLLETPQGRTNWTMTSGTTAPPPQSGNIQLRGVAGLSVKASRVTYQDMVADHVDLTIGRVAEGVPVPVKWSLDLTTSPGARAIPISGDATAEYQANSARLESLDARVDDSTLRGNAAVTNLKTGAMSFDLSLDQINLDRYLKPASSKGAPAPHAGAAPAAQPTELPTSALKTLTLNGKLAIGSATVYGIRATQVRAGLDASRGVLRIAPAAAQLYGGNYTGTVTLDAHGAVPVLHLDQSLAGIDVAPLLKDFAKTARFSGKGNVTMNVTAHGNTTDALLQTLGGHAAANLANGAIQGFNLWSDIDNAVALTQGHAPKSAGTGNETKFEVFKASADIANGVASTKDLIIASGDLHVTGQGTTNLLTNAVNYRLNAAILKSAANAGAAGGGALANIPLLVSGTLKSPSVRPDTEAVAKSLAQQQLDKHKGEVQQKLQSVLKGLIH
ncbi:MAG TPA: AsmA family protein [Steroidobacteraceae bacterium]